MPPDEEGTLVARVRASIAPAFLQEESANLLRLLLAADLMPNGGLYSGTWASLAVRRYVRHWLPLLLRPQPAADREALVPPVDVALVWLVHRCDVHAYAEDCIALQEIEYGGTAEPELLSPGPEQALAFSDGEDAAGQRTSQAWKGATATTPAYARRSSGAATSTSNSTGAGAAPSCSRQPYWPPQMYDSSVTAHHHHHHHHHHRPAAAWEDEMLVRICQAMPRASWLLHRLVSAGFTGSAVQLEQAVDRYYRFLLLAQRHQYMELLPPPDVLLVCWAHKAHSGVYLADMDLLMGCPFDLETSQLDDPELASTTADLYESELGLPYDMPCSQQRLVTCSSDPSTSATAAAAAAAAPASSASQHGGITHLLHAHPHPQQQQALTQALVEKLEPLLWFFESPTKHNHLTLGPGTPPLAASRGTSARRRSSCATGVGIVVGAKHTCDGTEVSGACTAAAAAPAAAEEGTRRSMPLAKIAGTLFGLRLNAVRLRRASCDPIVAPEPGAATAAVAAAANGLAPCTPPLPGGAVYGRAQTLDFGAPAVAVSPGHGAAAAAASAPLPHVLFFGGAAAASAPRISTGNASPEPIVVPLCSEVLALFHSTAQGAVFTARGSMGSRASVSGVPPGSGAVRAGADLLYLLWLLERELPVAAAAAAQADGGSGGAGMAAAKRWLALLRRTTLPAAAAWRRQQFDLALAKVLARNVARKAAGFAAFHNLPMRSTHPFWAAISGPRRTTAAPAAADASGSARSQAGAHASGGGDGSVGRHSVRSTRDGVAGEGPCACLLQPQPSSALAAVLEREAWDTAVGKAALWAQRGGAA